MLVGTVYARLRTHTIHTYTRFVSVLLHYFCSHHLSPRSRKSTHLQWAQLNIRFYHGSWYSISCIGCLSLANCNFSVFWLLTIQRLCLFRHACRKQAASPIDIRKFHRIVGSIYFSAVWESKTLILTAFIRDEDEKEGRYGKPVALLWIRKVSDTILARYRSIDTQSYRIST